jgi:hypothetical protein
VKFTLDLFESFAPSFSSSSQQRREKERTKSKKEQKRDLRQKKVVRELTLFKQHTPLSFFYL